MQSGVASPAWHPAPYVELKILRPQRPRTSAFPVPTRQDFKFEQGGPAVLIRRWFKCNEGWGKDSAAWYSAYDTFWGSNIHIWKK